MSFLVAGLHSGPEQVVVVVLAILFLVERIATLPTRVRRARARHRRDKAHYDRERELIERRLRYRTEAPLMVSKTTSADA